MLSLPYYAYVFSSTKLEDFVPEQDLPGSEGGQGDGRNDPNNACTCE
jgi:hypothetical protein